MPFVQGSFQIGKWTPDMPLIGQNMVHDMENAVWHGGVWRAFPKFEGESEILFEYRGWEQGECLLHAGRHRNSVNNEQFNTIITDRAYYLNSQRYALPNDITLTANTAINVLTFGQNIILTSGGGSLHRIDLSDTSMSIIAGSPSATCMGINGDILLVGVANKVRWANVNTYDGWDETATGTTADTQEFPDGGNVIGLATATTTYVFQKRTIRQLIPAPFPAIFTSRLIHKKQGLISPNALVVQDNAVFFLSNSGFNILVGEDFEPIGYQKVDRWFFEDVDLRFTERIVANTYSEKKWIIWSYKSTRDNPDFQDSHIIYNYAEDAWSLIRQPSLGTFNFFGETEIGYAIGDLSASGVDTTSPAGLPLKTIAELGLSGAVNEAGEAVKTDDTIAIIGSDTITINDEPTDKLLLSSEFGFIVSTSGRTYKIIYKEENISKECKFTTKWMLPTTQLPDLSPVSGQGVPEFYLRTTRGAYVKNGVAVGVYQKRADDITLPQTDKGRIKRGTINFNMSLNRNPLAKGFNSLEDVVIGETGEISICRASYSWQLEITLLEGWQEFHEVQVEIKGAEYFGVGSKL